LSYHGVSLLGENINTRKLKINKTIPIFAKIHANDWSLKDSGNAVKNCRIDNPNNSLDNFDQIEGSSLKYFQ
jgi:hypothetical protein